LKIDSIVKDAQDKLNAIERPEREDDFHQRYSAEIAEQQKDDLRHVF
jgi:hypothetical protein